MSGPSLDDAGDPNEAEWTMKGTVHIASEAARKAWKELKRLGVRRPTGLSPSDEEAVAIIDEAMEQNNEQTFEHFAKAINTIASKRDEALDALRRVVEFCSLLRHDGILNDDECQELIHAEKILGTGDPANAETQDTFRSEPKQFYEN